MNQNASALLSAEGIAQLISPISRVVGIEVVAETGSTNADLLARIDDFSGPCLLLARNQTAGRGRAGRSWLSEADSSLTFSLAWKFQLPIQALAGLPLAVGVALAESLADPQLRLKWPNDLLKQGDKVGGILIETAVAKQPGESAIWAVIGIGLNLALPEHMAQRIGRPAAGLGAGTQNRNQLMAQLLDGLVMAMNLFERKGFAAFADKWNSLHAYAGKSVCIIDRDKVLYEGIASGVDHAGRLLLDTAAGQVAVAAGDVSLRTAQS